MKRQKKNAPQHGSTQQDPPEFPLLHDKELMALVASFVTKRTRDMQAWACACKATRATLTDPVVLRAQAVFRGKAHKCHPVSHLLHEGRFATDRHTYGWALGMLLKDAAEDRIAPLSADEYLTSVDYCSKAEWWEGLGRLVAAAPQCVAADKQADVMSPGSWQKMLNEAAENDHVGVLLIMGDRCTADMATEALALASSMQFAQALLVKGADVANACARGALNHVLKKAPEEVELVELLLRGGADASAQSDNGTPLELAVEHMMYLAMRGSGDLSETVCPGLIRMLMQHGANPSRCAAIYHLASIESHPTDRTVEESFRLLLSRYGDISRRPVGQRHTLLACAALNGRGDLMNILLEAGADPVSALASVVAERAARPDAIRLLLDVPRVLTRIKRSDNNTLRRILHTLLGTMDCSLYNKYSEASVLRYVVQKMPGVIENTDAAGHTPLMAAVNKNKWNLAHELLALGADPFATCAQGKTALQLSVEHGFQMCAATILASVTDPKRRRELVDRRVGGLTLLHMVLKRSGSMRDRDLVEQLLRAGADPNAKTPEGHTCLHLALHSGEAAYVRSVLDFGANTQCACPDHPRGSRNRQCTFDSALIAMK